MYGKVQNSPQNEKTNFYPQSPYGVANYMPIGLLKITEKPIKFLLVMEFYSITKVQEEVKPLLQKKLFLHYVELSLVNRKNYI